MAASIMTAPSRQPFGTVSQARLQNLGNVQTSPHPTKHTFMTPKNIFVDADEVDSENVDPMSKDLAKINPKTNLDRPKLAAKGARIHLKTVNDTIKSVPAQPVPSKKRKGDNDDSTSLAELPKRRPAPMAASTLPASQLLSQRRANTKTRRLVGVPFSRLDRPSSTSRVPFSLKTSLAGMTKSKTSSESSAVPFKIYEDTPEEEMANIMEHSTNTLDISDDESGKASKDDAENKENVAPADCSPAVARRDMMSNESRTPLGHLDACSFYAEGCDENSVFVVSEDEENLPPRRSPAATTPIDSMLKTNVGRKLHQAAIKSKRDEAR